MFLATGTRLGPYEVLGPTGFGGMGEVYRARDTRLDRTVALKILPPGVAADPDRRARFEREARAISSLTHPNICTLYDVGEQQGQAFLVMEYLGGETLAARLARGPLPLAEALAVGAQIAEALDAAHQHGVIHRDLKPGNVMLTTVERAPVAKLLDFGIAKLRAHAEQPALDAGGLLTTEPVPAPLTGQGVALGTLQYMAPEQLEGREADARSDLWALGAILYEMVSGRRAFEAASQVSLIGNIMHAEPAPLATVQPLTPPALDRLVRTCLAKAPGDRWDSAHDVASELRWIAQSSASAPVSGGQPARRPLTVLGWSAAIAVSIAAIGAGVGWWFLSPLLRAPTVAHVSVDVRPAEELNAGSTHRSGLSPPGGTRTGLVLTPNADTLVFVGRRNGVQQLYVRRFDSAEARPLPNTEGAQVPALSPDGTWVVFWAGGAIKRVPVAGGPVTEFVFELPWAYARDVAPWGLAYDAQGRVFFGGENSAIWLVPAQGQPRAVTALGDTDLSHGMPSMLPGGRSLLFTVRKRRWSSGDDEIAAVTLETGVRRLLLKDASDGRYLPTGHLVFLRRGVLFAVPFDAERLEVHGAPVAVLDGVAQALTASLSGDVTGAGQFALSANGTLAWVARPLVSHPDATLVTVDRRGHVTPLAAPARSFTPLLRLSPDGRRLAVTVWTTSDVGLWIYDIGRGSLSSLARGGEAVWPLWAPDGQRLFFNWLNAGRQALVSQAADGTTPLSVLVPGNFDPSSISPDGRQLTAVTNFQDILSLELANGTVAVRPLIQTPASERWPELSPDGRWLAYGSDVSGRYEVYVRPHPGPGSATMVSLDGGTSPAWHRNGRELFFVAGDGPASIRRMMVADFQTGLPPSVGRPRVLFEYNRAELTLDCVPLRCYDVAPDGQHFYGVQQRVPPPLPAVTHVNLIQNWFVELKAKVPATR